MGLDMRPMGKAKPGFEQRYYEIMDLVSDIDNGKKQELSIWDKLKGKKAPNREELLTEWFANLIPTYETIKAPMVGRDEQANQWLSSRYEVLDEKSMSYEEFEKEHEGYYVIDLAEELDGVPLYCSFGQDENVLRGQFLNDCLSIIDEDLVYDAWETKRADATLDYGNRLMEVADKLAQEHNLGYLKTQREIPDVDEDTMEAKLHILYAVAKWLIFYGKNGHGYEADF
ncbi:hypothetical protein [Myroides sp. N17-2]|uniref:hypothetical protein n=1 Tax=Myroides sp. N17-2 TaxID=2030799 RepID=UPI001C1F71AD|nr:hypothetical protein [Myroides sp. N17-2]